MDSLCGSYYYLKVRDVRVRLILCLPDSNRNSTGEFVLVSGKWQLACHCVTLVGTEHF